MASNTYSVVLGTSASCESLLRLLYNAKSVLINVRSCTHVYKQTELPRGQFFAISVVNSFIRTVTSFTMDFDQFNLQECLLFHGVNLTSNPEVMFISKTFMPQLYRYAYIVPAIAFGIYTWRLSAISYLL